MNLLPNVISCLFFPSFFSLKTSVVHSRPFEVTGHNKAFFRLCSNCVSFRLFRLRYANVLWNCAFSGIYFFTERTMNLKSIQLPVFFLSFFLKFSSTRCALQIRPDSEFKVKGRAWDNGTFLFSHRVFDCIGWFYIGSIFSEHFKGMQTLCGIIHFLNFICK